MHAIRTRIGIFSAGQHHQEARCPHLLAIYLLGKRQEVARALFYAILSSELHFYASPAPVIELDDSIGFETVLVSVVIDLSSKRTRIDAQVSDTERLEQIAHCVQIVEQTLCIAAQ